MQFVFLSVFFLFLNACNFNQNVAIRGVDLHTHQNNGDTYLDLETIVSLGNLKLPNSNYPITNPEQKNIGEISVQHLDDGTSRLSVSVNYDEASKLDSSLGKTLPNGREIPNLLAHDVSLIGIPIIENSRVYLGGSLKGNLYAGIALNAPVFDHILTPAPTPLNLFLMFPFSSDVLGIAGIYSGPQNGQNGLAIFAKKSQQKMSSRTLATVNEDTPSEWNKLDRITLFRLHYLFKKNAIIRIK